MRYTVSIKKNRDFRRLYAKGKTAVNAYLVVYCRRNKTAVNRLGLTVGTRVGKAVVRKPCAPPNPGIVPAPGGAGEKGYDIVIVARTRGGRFVLKIDAALAAL